MSVALVCLDRMIREWSPTENRKQFSIVYEDKVCNAWDPWVIYGTLSGQTCNPFFILKALGTLNLHKNQVL